MARQKFTLSPLIGYHGCSQEVAERLLARDTPVISENAYDWLGPGMYFWLDSLPRALSWALEQKKRHSWPEASAVGALIHPGLCMNLTDEGVVSEVQKAYEFLEQAKRLAGESLPKNYRRIDGLDVLRPLDNEVIKVVHQLREVNNLEKYDTVFGVFEEGGPAFPASGMREKTHIQIAVRNLNCIVGFFRIPGPE